MKNLKNYKIMEALIILVLVGILSTVVIFAINSARKKSGDMTVKAGLNQVRTQADVYFNYNGSYSDVCNPAKDGRDPKGINKMVSESAKSDGFDGTVSYNGDSSTNDVKCNSTENGWAAQVPLKNEQGYYCVDYTKKGIVTLISIGNANAFCR